MALGLDARRTAVAVAAVVIAILVSLAGAWVVIGSEPYLTKKGTDHRETIDAR